MPKANFLKDHHGYAVVVAILIGLIILAGMVWDSHPAEIFGADRILGGAVAILIGAAVTSPPQNPTPTHTSALYFID